MKAAVVVVLVAMAAFSVSADKECDMLARLNVKSQWMRAYSSGHDREHFAEAIWRAVFAQVPEARSLFDRVGGDDTASPKFIGHAMRVLASLDIAINLLDQPDALSAQLEHLHQQHEERHIPASYYKAIDRALLHVLPAQLGRCFDKEPWVACFHAILDGIHG